MQSIQNMITARLHLAWPLLLGLAAAYLLSGFAEFKSPSSAAPGPVVTDLYSEHDRSSWQGIILEKNILNLEIPANNPGAWEPETAKEMKGWKLLGTFTGERDLALLSINGQTKLLAPGQSVEGWELSKILPQSTRWRSSARTRSLDMWSQDEDSEPLATPSRTSPAPVLHGSRKATLSSQDVQPFLNDPNMLLRMAQFKPYSNRGETTGFQISNIRNNSMLQKIGFRNGDVLTRIDGRPITGPSELLQAYSSFSRSSLISMDILRQGDNISLLVEIE